LSKKENLILISIDALRSDYSRSEECMPFLSDFAKSSIRFDKAVTANGWTCPSMASIHTSSYSDKHGVKITGHKLDRYNQKTIAEVLKEEGYSTFGFSSIESLNKRYKFDRGFTEYYDHKYLDNFLTSAGFGRYNLLNLIRKLKLINRNKYHITNGSTINKRISKAITKVDSEPFFIWAHYFDIQLPKVQQLEVFKRKNLNPTESEYIDFYREGVSNIDQIFKNLIDILKEKGIYDNTNIIVTSDHGEHLFQRGMGLTHGVTLYDFDIMVPLIIKLVNEETHVSNKVVRTIDIFPTILDILKFKSSDNLEGESVLPLNELKDREALTEAVAGDRKSIRDGQWKYIWTGTNPMFGFNFGEARVNELYDIKIDPDEKENIISKSKVQASTLNSKLAKFFPEINTSHIESAQKQIERMDSKTKDLLSDLGYLKKEK